MILVINLKIEDQRVRNYVLLQCNLHMIRALANYLHEYPCSCFCFRLEISVSNIWFKNASGHIKIMVCEYNKIRMPSTRGCSKVHGCVQGYLVVVETFICVPYGWALSPKSPALMVLEKQMCVIGITWSWKKLSCAYIRVEP